ncbi:MAG: hypothetical protein U9R49_02500 [Bacteroidota bacterium]|nr:hypothetical protein [Bacteroidota bacterium]
MITNFVVFAFITGLLTGAVVVGATFWAKALGLKMNWWKWLLSTLWYILLLFLLFAAFTFIGEGEVAAGWKTLGISVVILVILGTGLARMLLAGRKQPES